LIQKFAALGYENVNRQVKHWSFASPHNWSLVRRMVLAGGVYVNNPHSLQQMIENI
jgi:hypothetical protein